jgi:hypothetical protein
LQRAAVIQQAACAGESPRGGWRSATTALARADETDSPFVANLRVIRRKLGGVR